MEFLKLLKFLEKNKLDVVYGSRFMKKNEKYSLVYYMGNKTVSWFTSLLYFRKVTDVETCYKLFKSKLLKNFGIEGDGFEWEAEITAKVFRSKCRFGEIAISYKPRSREEGKKINSKDFFKAIFTLLRYRWV